MTRRRHPNYRPLATLPPELRRPSVPPAVRSWIRRELRSDVRRTRRLAGASSTAVHRLDLADGRSVVLRRYVWPGFTDEEPEAPQREIEALRFAAAHALPAPTLLAADPNGSLTGIPAIVMTFVPGSPRAVPDLVGLAEVAATIHAVDASTFPYTYYPWYQGTVVEPPAGATDQRLWSQAIAIWHTRMPPFGAGFLHRDFHPGNVLWRRSLAHVVDWANACAGPWGCDLAHCRDNLMQLADIEVADAFLSAYLDITGATYDPYWEIASVLEHSPASFIPERIALSEARLRPAVAAYQP